MGWSATQQNNYSVYAKRYIAIYNSKIDCADLALATLIDFAGIHRLPIKLKYYSGGWQWVAHEVTPDNSEAIKVSMMRDFGALNVIDNTKPIQIDDAIAGDLIMSRWTNTLGHTRIIHSIKKPENEGDGYEVTWYQGTLPPIIPMRKIDTFSDIEGVYGRTPRRWKFEQFNAV